MLRGIVSTRTKLQNTSVLSFKSVGINALIPQTIRWKTRKPSWLPPGKTKLFRIRPRVLPPKDEDVEILRLFNYYRTTCKSIRQFIIAEAEVNQVQYNEENIKKNAEADFEHCKQINDEWNRQIALTREARLKKEWEVKKAEVFRRIEEKQALQAKEQAKAEEYIKKVKQAASTFITKETIDQAIAETLEKVVNYNEAIDLQGNRYHEIIETRGHRV